MSELPPGFHFVDRPRGQSFRELLVENGDTLQPDDAPECWVAWFLDARSVDGVETYDVNVGPIEDEWPG